MAKASMGYTHTAYDVGPEILFNSEYVGEAVTLDSTAFTNGVCKAGTPIDVDGKVWAAAQGGGTNPEGLGILLHDVYSARPVGTVVIGGYINATVASTHSGVTYTSTIKALFKNIVFCANP